MSWPRLYDDACREILAEGLRRGWLIALDFDGTLAPFVADPTQAAIPPALFADLEKLAGLRRVVILSGRSREDVRRRVPANVVEIVGNHGCESATMEPQEFTAATRIVEDWAQVLAITAPPRGLRMENKGLSLALHWRGTTQRLMDRQAAKIALDLTPRPQFIPGDQVLNLLPPDLPHKGTALIDMLTRFSCPGAVFMGDDVTDAAVFHLRSPHVIGIEVGIKGLGADWHLPDIGGVHGVICDMIAMLQE